MLQSEQLWRQIQIGIVHLHSLTVFVKNLKTIHSPIFHEFISLFYINIYKVYLFIFPFTIKVYWFACFDSECQQISKLQPKTSANVL